MTLTDSVLVGEVRPLPVLYSFRRCPYAMRARLAIVASGMKVEIREIVLRNKPEHMLSLSPKGTVPVLWLTDGTVLEQSLDVMKWALGLSDRNDLMKLSVDERVGAEQIVAVLDGEFKHHLDRYKYPERYSAKEEGFDRMSHRSAGVEILRGWSDRIAAQGHLVCDRLTWVDLAALPFVRQFRIPEPEWFDSLPEIAALSKRLAEFVVSPWFEAAMVKLEPWKPGDAAIVFPK
ncbi:MAG: glutathione S-transferase N-terminal domain-containing protein [Limnobacter sp.]|nr:glutathione S-transferase N-terminal domain-containing protein [Limnobacter sp.]